MKFLPAISCLALISAAAAQNIPGTRDSEAVENAIREFHARKNKPANEVSVALPPPDETPENTGVKPESVPAAAEIPRSENHATPETSPPPTEQEIPTEAENTAESPAVKTVAEPVLVTGKPPENIRIEDLTETETPKKEGVTVRVEKLQTGQGPIDPKKVDLQAPFPPKPIGAAPVGWHLENPESVAPVSREIELGPGAKIHLSIRPHILVPDSDGATSFSVREPGYDASLGYLQTATVGAILSRTVARMDDDTKQLGQVIDQLQQLMASLPKNETPPRAIPAESRKR